MNDMETLIHRAKLRDRHAMDELARLLTPVIQCKLYDFMGFKWAYDIDDLVQEIFIVIWQKLVQLKHPRAFWTWAVKIAERKALNYIQATKRGRKIFSFDPPDLNEIPSAYSTFDEVVKREPHRGLDLVALFQTLDPRLRVVMNDYYITGLQMRQVAEKRKIPLGTVKRRLHDGRQRIKHLL